MDLAGIIKANVVLQINSCTPSVHTQVLVAVHRHPDLQFTSQAQHPRAGAPTQVTSLASAGSVLVLASLKFANVHGANQHKVNQEHEHSTLCQTSRHMCSASQQLQSQSASCLLQCNSCTCK